MSYWGQNAGFQLRPVMSAQQAQARYQPTQQMPAQPMQRPMQAQVPMQRPMGLLGGSQPGGLLGSELQFDARDPFAAGQALNNRYATLFQRDAGMSMPDMRQFGNRYAAELSSEGGRRNLGRNMGQAQTEVGRSGGFYKAGDFDMLPGLSFDDPWTKANYGNLFRNGNSYFVPDKVEADAHLYALNSPMSRNMTKEQQSKLFSEMYDGGALVNRSQGVQGQGRGDFGPESVMRALLDYRSSGKGFNAAISNPVYEARNVLAGMDVGRGGLSDQQAKDLVSATEAKTALINSRSWTQAHEKSLNDGIQSLTARLQAESDPAMRAQYESEILGKGKERDMVVSRLKASEDDFRSKLAKVRLLPTSPDLSSFEIIQGLLGG